jgi:hypothetical protein
MKFERQYSVVHSRLFSEATVFTKVTGNINTVLYHDCIEKPAAGYPSNHQHQHSSFSDKYVYFTQLNYYRISDILEFT